MEKPSHLDFSGLSAVASLRFCLFQACILSNTVSACSCVCTPASANGKCDQKKHPRRGSPEYTLQKKAAGLPTRSSLVCLPLPSSAVATLQSVYDIQIVGGLTNRTRQQARNSIPVEIRNSSVQAAFSCVCAFFCVTSGRALILSSL